MPVGLQNPAFQENQSWAEGENGAKGDGGHGMELVAQRLVGRNGLSGSGGVMDQMGRTHKKLGMGRNSHYRRDEGTGWRTHTDAREMHVRRLGSSAGAS